MNYEACFSGVMEEWREEIEPALADLGIDVSQSKEWTVVPLHITDNDIADAWEIWNGLEFLAGVENHGVTVVASRKPVDRKKIQDEYGEYVPESEDNEEQEPEDYPLNWHVFYQMRHLLILNKTLDSEDWTAHLHAKLCDFSYEAYQLFTPMMNDEYVPSHGDCRGTPRTSLSWELSPIFAPAIYSEGDED